MKRCSGCRKTISPSEKFLEINEGLPEEDGSGWRMKTLKQYHLTCLPWTLSQKLEELVLPRPARLKT